MTTELTVLPDQQIEKPPKWTSTPYYKKLLKLIEDKIQSAESFTQQELSKKTRISQQRISEILRSEYFKKEIQAIFDRKGIEDLSTVYNNIRTNSKNPNHARLFLQYFSPIRPKDTPAGGNIILNLNLFRADVISDKVNKDIEIEDAEYTPIVQADKNQ